MKPWKVTLRLYIAEFFGVSTEGDSTVKSKRNVLVRQGVTVHKLHTQAITGV